MEVAKVHEYERERDPLALQIYKLVFNIYREKGCPYCSACSLKRTPSFLSEAFDKPRCVMAFGSKSGSALLA